jgi:L-ascorbate metabolism protein UlaG (beta-lactamase superfamily)
MKTKFIGHSSILIESGKDKILCDPWYTGTAFNDGWKLLSEPKTDINDLDFNYIWYSHEHPDHFSVVDIKKIDKEKRKNITILFQETIDNKVKDFCIKNDFKVKELEPFKVVKLSDSLEIINGTDGFDSWLCVKDSEKTILNLNDCRLDDVDELNKVKDKIGNIDALYTQFGYANWAGNPRDTKGPKIGRRIVESQLKNQIDILKPRVVVPFASFVWFCHEENAFWNDLSIGIRESYDFLSNISDKVHVFYPGDEWVVGEDWNHDEKNIELYAFDKFKRSMEEPKVSKSYSISDLQESFGKMVEKIKNKNDWEEILNFKESNGLDAAIVGLTDLEIVVSFDITESGLNIVNDEPHIEMSSDSLKYIMDFAWGRGTLMINSRFSAVYDKFDSFFMQTAIFYANNIGLSFPKTLTADDLGKNSSFALELMREWEL